ncbi:hypothetical protein LPB248_00770 [Flavobacterium sp. LPB0248]|uniref:DUF6625 family protein n=1 Tax=Flavobacterium sp. LPB0248 TaxID=2614441 RepID=UPI0015A65139|nr:DUF6625 family protein [Flavobacterium sp. LPB0248]QLC64861.1 hypothetical protein LPB248_00770 [Flavobacterium sp. LPB0248]
MNNSHSIAMITCWYGVYPWYFPYFIKSCSYNPTIDFFIVTDNREEIFDKPDNVIIIDMTLEEFKINATKKLGFDIVLNNPYKLCDYKPAYGFLFSDLIASYDFWGHGDIDMVYGDIRGFITDELLENYDIINTRHDFITGTFCLYRNNEKMNMLFTESRDYKHVFTQEQHFSFVECNFLYHELSMGYSIFDFPSNIQSMTYLAMKGNQNGDFRVFFDHIIAQGMSNRIRWDNGIILFKDQFECLFYDMIDYKVKCKNKKVTYPIPDIFYFNKKGINKNSFIRLSYLRLQKKLQKIILF